MSKPRSIILRELTRALLIFGTLTNGPGLVELPAAETSVACWNQFHGPNGSGVASDDVAAPVEFGTDKNVLWRAELLPGHSSPCVAGERIFVTAYEAENRTLVTICLDASTGEQLWSQPATAEEIERHHEISNPATSTPATDGNVVVVYFGSAGLFAYDFDGNELWQKRLPVAKTFRQFGSGTSPIVADGKVVLDMQLEGDSYLAAYDIATGHEAWKAPRPIHNKSWSTPIVWSEGEARRVGLPAAGRFSAYDLASGQEAWWVDGVGNQVCATPVVEGDKIVISSAGVLGERDNVIIPPAFDEFLAQHDTNQDGSIATDEIPDSMLVADRKAAGGAGNMPLKQILPFFAAPNATQWARADWEKMRQSITAFSESDLNKTNVMAVRTGGAGDVTNSHVVWQETRGVPEVPSPLTYRDRVWMIKTGGVLTCLALANGKVVFQGRVGKAGGYYASPVAGGGRIYVASDDGAVTVLDAGDELKVLAHNELPDAVLATPAIVDGTLFIRTTKQLFAFRE
jgi:outer membrane protein assembly factor BamB